MVSLRALRVIGRLTLVGQESFRLCDGLQDLFVLLRHLLHVDHKLGLVARQIQICVLLDLERWLDLISTCPGTPRTRLKNDMDVPLVPVELSDLRSISESATRASPTRRMWLE